MPLHEATLTPYRLPFHRPYTTATADHRHRHGLLLQLTDEAGRTGVGEAAPLSNRTEDPARTRAALEGARSLVERERPEPDALLAGLDDLPALNGAPAARAGLATALCDLLAQQADQPMAGWLAARFATTSVADVPVNATLPSRDPAAMAEAARAWARDGFTTFKLKLGRDKDRDAERVEAVRAVLPDHGRVRVDANQAWAPMEAIERIGELDEGGDVELVEQPTPADDVRALALVRECVDVPVAADEALTGPEALEELVALDACDVAVIKPMVVGGPDRALALALQARGAGLDVVVTTTIDAAPGRAMALHVAAALGEERFAHGLATARLLAEDVVAHDERVREGVMPVPEGIGLGVRL